MLTENADLAYSVAICRAAETVNATTDRVWLDVTVCNIRIGHRSAKALTDAITTRTVQSGPG